MSLPKIEITLEQVVKREEILNPSIQSVLQIRAMFIVVRQAETKHCQREQCFFVGLERTNKSASCHALMI